MFIRIENQIINIEEIRNIAMLKDTGENSWIQIHFKNTTESTSFSSRPNKEAQKIIDTLAEACLSYSKK